MKSMYLHDFDSEESMLKEFAIDKSVIKGYKVLLASYTYECYEGSAFVLMRDKLTKELVTVYGSHCSCYGLEGQFDIEKSSIEQIQKLYDENYYTYREIRDELGAILKHLRKKKL